MDDFLLELQAKLDEIKSKSNIESDIDTIQKQLDKHIKIQAEIDPQSLKNIVKQIESITGQKIDISNIKFDAKIGNKIGESVSDNIVDGVRKSGTKLSSEIQKITNQVSKIRVSLDSGEYDSKVDNLVARTQRWTDENGNARISTDNLAKALKELGAAQDKLSENNTLENQQALIEKEKNLQMQIKTVTSEVRSMNAELAKSSSISSLHNQVADFMSKNGKTVKYFGEDLRYVFEQTKKGAKLTNQQLAELKQKFVEVQNEAREAGKLGKTWFQTVKDSIPSFTSWLSASGMVMTAIGKGKEGISTVKDLDTALVDLKKTADMSTQQMEDFYYASNDVAKQMGSTTEEILNQASAWSRLGYATSEEATQMAKYSSMFSMISPGMDIDTATNGLVSMMKAFKIGADDVSEVVDGIMSKVNIIGNTRALDNSDIVEVLRRSSSAMAEANNTIEDTIALGTAIVEVTRDAANAGQVLKTVSMRIRGYDEETEEYIGGIEELSGEIADLTKTASTPGGISLFSDAAKTEFKSTRELFSEIAEIYDQLSDKDQAQLLEALAGKRNGQAVAAILNNYEAVEDSLNSMANSAGNAEAEMAVAMDSVEYKLNRLKETGTGIAQNLFGREEMKSIIDALTKVGEAFDWLTDKIGLFGSIGLGTGLFAGFRNIGKFVRAYNFKSYNNCFKCFEYALHA